MIPARSGVAVHLADGFRYAARLGCMPEHSLRLPPNRGNRNLPESWVVHAENDHVISDFRELEARRATAGLPIEVVVSYSK